MSRTLGVITAAVIGALLAFVVSVVAADLLAVVP